MVRDLPAAPRGFFTELAAAIGYALASLLSGLLLYAYLVAVELHVVSGFLGSEAVAFAPLQLTESRQRDIQRRRQAFVEARRRGVADTLSLDNDEINQWFAVIGSSQRDRDRVRLSMREDVLTARVSLPMQGWGFPGRFLNGEVGLRMVYQDGVLDVGVDGIEVGGQPLPPRTLDAVKVAVFVLSRVFRESQDRKFRNIGRFRITGGRFVAHSK